MSYGVMVAQQVLVLFVEVRILVGQQQKVEHLLDFLLYINYGNDAKSGAF